jgi:hypothetical protein
MTKTGLEFGISIFPVLQNSSQSSPAKPSNSDLAKDKVFSAVNKISPHLRGADHPQGCWILPLYSIIENSIINFLRIKKDLFF